MSKFTMEDIVNPKVMEVRMIFQGRKVCYVHIAKHGYKRDDEFVRGLEISSYDFLLNFINRDDVQAQLIGDIYKKGKEPELIW